MLKKIIIINNIMFNVNKTFAVNYNNYELGHEYICINMLY